MMSRFTNAYPPIESAGDAKALNGILRVGMGETDWSIQPTLVDATGIHYLATCHCENCLEIRNGAHDTPTPREEIEKMIAEEEAQRQRRQEAIQANLRYQRGRLE